MTRRLAPLLLAAALALALSGAQAQQQGGLTLAAGAPLPGGVSSGGGLVVTGSLAQFGTARASGGRFSLVGGLAPAPAGGERGNLPLIVR